MNRLYLVKLHRTERCGTFLKKRINLFFCTRNHKYHKNYISNFFHNIGNNKYNKLHNFTYPTAKISLFLLTTHII